MQKTLQQEMMEAAIRGLPPARLEARLIREIALGRKWGIDTVLAEIGTERERWARINLDKVLVGAASYGRLTPIRSICECLGYDKNVSDISAPACIIDGFHEAVIQGNYRTADYFYELGARPSYAPHTTGDAMFNAIVEGDSRAVTYLVHRETKQEYFCDSLLYAMRVQKPDEVVFDMLLKEVQNVEHRNLAIERIMEQRHYWNGHAQAEKVREVLKSMESPPKHPIVRFDPVTR